MGAIIGAAVRVSKQPEATASRSKIVDLPNVAVTRPCPGCWSKYLAGFQEIPKTGGTTEHHVQYGQQRPAVPERTHHKPNRALFGLENHAASKLKMDISCKRQALC